MEKQDFTFVHVQSSRIFFASDSVWLISYRHDSVMDEVNPQKNGVVTLPIEVEVDEWVRFPTNDQNKLHVSSEKGKVSLLPLNQLTSESAERSVHVATPNEVKEAGSTVTKEGFMSIIPAKESLSTFPVEEPVSTVSTDEPLTTIPKKGPASNISLEKSINTTPTGGFASNISIVEPRSSIPTKKTMAKASSDRNLSELRERLMKKSGWDAISNNDQFSAYMCEKHRKLREQYSIEAATLGLIKNLKGGVKTFKPKSKTIAKTSAPFAGVIVWVNGRTSPTRLDVRRLVMRGGGSVETYLTPRVTHVVADTLARASQRRLLDKRNGTKAHLHFVSAAWVAQSAKGGTRLPEWRFPIPGTRDCFQKSIVSLFSTKPRAQLKPKRSGGSSTSA